MPRPTGTAKKKQAKENIVKDLIEGNIKPITEGKKYRKEIVFDSEIKNQLESEAKKRGLTVTGFIRYCVMKELND